MATVNTHEFVVDTCDGFRFIRTTFTTNETGKHDKSYNFHMCDDLDCCYTHWTIIEYKTGRDDPTKVYFTKTPASFIFDVSEICQTIQADCYNCRFHESPMCLQHFGLAKTDYKFKHDLVDIFVMLVKVLNHTHGKKLNPLDDTIKCINTKILSRQSDKVLEIDAIIMLGMRHELVTQDDKTRIKDTYIKMLKK